MAAKNANEDTIDTLSNLVIGCALAFSYALGSGFFEKVYENALAYALPKRDLAVAQQGGGVRYHGVIVGEYITDLLIEDAVLVEIKAVKALAHVHRVQCLNHLKAIGLRLCLLLNFGQPRLAITRAVQIPRGP